MTGNLLIADRAFDADSRVRDRLAAGKVAVIPPRPNRLITLRIRSRILQRAPPDREFLLQTQPIPRDRNALRQNRQEFPCRHPPRRRYYLAQLTTGPRQVDFKRKGGSGYERRDRAIRRWLFVWRGAFRCDR